MNTNLNIIYNNILFSFWLQTFLSLSILICTVLIYFESKRNILYSLIYMILIYFLFYPFFIFMKYDFLGTALIIIYVGAVAILFMFVILTIETKKIIVPNLFFTNKFMNNFFIYLLVIHLVFFFYFLLKPYIISCHHIWFDLYEYDLTLDALISKTSFSSQKYVDSFFLSKIYFNITLVGYFLYTYCCVHLIIFGLILLIGMVGATIFFIKI